MKISGGTELGSLRTIYIIRDRIRRDAVKVKLHQGIGESKGGIGKQRVYASLKVDNGHLRGRECNNSIRDRAPVRRWRRKR